MVGKKDYKDIASMQKNPSVTGSTGATRGKPKTATGGRIKVSTGGRVKKQGGGPGRVAPKVTLTPRQQMDATIRPQMAQMDREMKSQMERGRANAPQPVPPGTIRPGGRTGGKVAKAKGGRVKKAGGGREPQFRTDESGRKGQAAYYGHVAPKAAAKQLKKKPPGRAATQGIGMKKGGRVSKAKGGKAKR